MRIAAIFVLVFCLLVIAFVAWGLHNHTTPVHSEFHHIYPLSASGTFALDNPAGDIKIIAWKGDSVQVDARLCAPTAEELKNLSLEAVSTPQVLTITTRSTEQPLGWFSWIRLLGWTTRCNERPEVDYTVRVPLLARVQLTTADGDITVAGVTGGLALQTASGDVSAQDDGDVAATTASGDVTITRARGSIDLCSTSGDLLSHDVTGDLHANSTSGDVKLYQFTGKATVSTTSGSIRVRSFAGIARFSTGSGDISMTLLRDTGVALNASTVDGDIESEVPLRLGAPIDATSVSGDISARFL